MKKLHQQFLVKITLNPTGARYKKKTKKSIFIFSSKFHFRKSWILYRNVDIFVHTLIKFSEKISKIIIHWYKDIRIVDYNGTGTLNSLI